MFAVTLEVMIIMEQQMVCMLLNRQNSFLVSAEEAYVCQTNYSHYWLIERIIFSSLIKKKSQADEQDDLKVKCSVI